MGRALEDGELAIVLAHQNRGGEAHNVAGALQGLHQRALVLGVVGELVDAVLVQPGAWPVEVTGVDVDGHDLEVLAAVFDLERVERGHLLAARCAPGGPEIDEHGLAGEVRERQRLALGAGEGERR